MGTRLICIRRHFFSSFMSLLSIGLAYKNVVKERLRYFIFRKVRPVTTPEGFKISSIQEHISYWDLFIDKSIHGDYLFGLKNVIDIGSNYGLFCRLVWKYSPYCSIMAYEPQPKFCRLLESWKAKNFDIVEVALSDRKGNGKLNCPLIGESASLVGWEGSPTIDVCTDRLDDLYNGDFPVDLLKIDVDGGELGVLRGAINVLSKTKKVLIEIQDEGVHAFLCNLGFSGKKLSTLDWLYTKN